MDALLWAFIGVSAKRSLAMFFSEEPMFPYNLSMTNIRGGILFTPIIITFIIDYNIDT